MNMKDAADESRRRHEHGDLSGTTGVSPDGERRPWTTPVLCDLSTGIPKAEGNPGGPSFDPSAFDS